MSIPPLPTKEFTILCLAAALFMIYLVVFLIAFCLDESELSMCKVIYFQDRVGRSDDVFCLTFKVKDKLFTKGTTDLIFRLRGSARDGPLILYRDVLGDVFKSGAVVNMGVALQLNIGSLNEIDIACDNDSCEEGKAIMRISDVFVRQLPKAKTLKALPVKSSYGAFKAHASNVLLNAPGTGLRTWVGLDSVTAKTGSGVTGIRGFKHGKASVLRARDVAFSMPLTGETARFKKQAKLGFRPLHYLCSMSSKWHDPWSNFSRLDHAMVMCLDQLTVMVAISAAYAFNLESALGVDGIQGALQPSFPTSDFIKIEDFNLYDAITFVTAQGFFQNVLCLISVLWIALISNLLVCPLSLLWCRLFRIVGGKEFEKTYLSSLPAQVEEKVSLRSFTAPSLSMGPCVPCTAVARTSSNSLMLRTLECRSVHTASSVSSTRQLRMEPMISNCSPDHITARSVAYVRTKMTRLRDNSILSGPSGIKHPEVLHESHTQSTDAPVMPPPATAPDGKGEVVRVARFCERLVQQAPEHIRDNTMIAECFEVAHEAPPARNALEPHDGGDRRSLATKEDMCCPRQCCRRHMKCAEECKLWQLYYLQLSRDTLLGKMQVIGLGINRFRNFELIQTVNIFHQIVINCSLHSYSGTELCEAPPENKFTPLFLQKLCLTFFISNAFVVAVVQSPLTFSGAPSSLLACN
ncbi:unnamed protein product [Clavelina lepadiformis]|uniref:Uncharacterized protein n=1 Tax=Clavelina lepadiformis TaxID=159417 RepID=A0ABP0FXV1_CLALP